MSTTSSTTPRPTTSRSTVRARWAALAVLPVLAITGCGGAATSAGAAPEAFPPDGATIEWVVPSAAGGGNDILARIVAPALGEELGATVQVVNREGGNQVIGLTALATAEPDGTTLGNTNLPSILGRYLDPSQQATFDRASFTPVGSFASNDIVIAVPTKSPYQTVADLVAAAKADPGAVTAGTDSRAGDDHVNLAILEQELGIDLNVVHYDSGADKVAALIAGEVDLALGGVSSVFGPAESGDVRLLTVVADEPSPFLPQVPTLASAGFDGVESMTSRFTLSVPAGTPDTTVTALQDALEKATARPAVQEALKGAATQPDFLDAQEAAALWAEREAVVKPIIADLLTQQ